MYSDADYSSVEENKSKCVLIFMPCSRDNYSASSFCKKKFPRCVWGRAFPIVCYVWNGNNKLEEHHKISRSYSDSHNNDDINTQNVTS